MWSGALYTGKGVGFASWWGWGKKRFHWGHMEVDRP